MPLEELLDTDTFEQWKDKINALIQETNQQRIELDDHESRIAALENP